MEQIRLNCDKISNFISAEEFREAGLAAEFAKKRLLEKTGKGSECLGWVDWPECCDIEELKQIQRYGNQIREDSEVLIVIGIGGSYLGSRAAIEYILPDFYNQLSKEERGAPEIYFAGHQLSGAYIRSLIRIIGDRDFSVNVISKSGTTTEPSIAFRIFHNLLIERYGKEGAGKRIYATTDDNSGSLRQMSEKYGYRTLTIPEQIGGRFSVLTAVGMLPIVVAGGDIFRMLEGARVLSKEFKEKAFLENDALKYAAIRNIFYHQGKRVEILAGHGPCLHFLEEWWKQLFGESEGKDKKGIFPAAIDLTTDLHSIGQTIQDGSRILFETILNIDEMESVFIIEPDEDNMDNLNYLAGKSISDINECSIQGTLLAHNDGGTPSMVIHIPNKDIYYLGQLFYFFEFSVAISGYMLGVNPFNQPGVEAYKANTFALLGKPGYEEGKEALKKRL